MPADEIAAWFIRFAYIIVGAFVIAGLFTMLSPDLPENELRAQALAARVAHDGGFWQEPGVIDPQQFTQQTANDAVDYGEPLMDVGLRATVQNANEDVVLGPIDYNRGAVTKLSILPGADNLVWEFPVTVEGEYQKLILEVWYE